MTSHAGVDSAVQGFEGAREHLTKPFDFVRLGKALADVRTELARRAQVVALEGAVARELEFCGMLGRSPAMQEVFSLIQRLAPHAKSVLLNGETGTGKELAARAFHKTGPRRARPFLTINCSAVVDTLFESELPATSGCITGAVDGGLVRGGGGTLFSTKSASLAAGRRSCFDARTRSSGWDRSRESGGRHHHRGDQSRFRADVPPDACGDLFYRLVVELTPCAQRGREVPYLTAARG
jgi:two-component system response regulator PilR (NtrC family)